MKPNLNILLSTAALCALCASVSGLVACSSSAHSHSNTADGVIVSPASEVRQGLSGVTLSFERASGGLANPSKLDLADLEAVVEASSTDTHLVLTVNVPHGVISGARTLNVVTAAGPLTLADVIDVTAISAAPGGSDSNLGTTSSPFRTLAQAVSVAGANDTCALAAGVYSTADGEAWGYAPSGPGPLTITGASAASTVLRGPGAAALMPAGNLTLQHLSFLGFSSAVSITEPARVALQDVVIGGGAEGIIVGGTGSSIDLSGGRIDSSGYGIEFGATCVGCALSIDGTTLTQSSDGAIIQVPKTSQHSALTFKNAVLNGGTFVADTAATISVQDSQLSGNDANAALNFGGTRLDASGSTFTAGTGPYGINLESGVMKLTNDTIVGNQYGVYQLAGTSTMRGTKISGYTSIGFYFASGDLDLGTATDAGNNSFIAARDGAFGLYVDASTTPLSCSNTSFDGVMPATSVVMDTGTDLLEQAHEYVLTPGKTISFFTVP